MRVVKSGGRIATSIGRAEANVLRIKRALKEKSPTLSSRFGPDCVR